MIIIERTTLEYLPRTHEGVVKQQDHDQKKKRGKRLVKHLQTSTKGHMHEDKGMAHARDIAKTKKR